MKELIKITKNGSGKDIVSAIELYKFLGLASQHYAKWYHKNITQNEFVIENEDFVKLPLDGRSQDFALTIDFAKRISMMARTTKGEEIRNYFVECEKLANQLTVSIPSYQIEDKIERANKWIEEQKVTLKLQERNQKLEPRSLYFDKMINTDGLVSMQEVAKLLNIKDMGRNKLFEKLRTGNVIMKSSTVPYQHFVNKGYFELKEEIVILKGGVRKVNVTTYATQKGLAFIFKFFGLTEK